MGAENFAPTGIHSPNRPARSESLYRLSHSGRCSQEKKVYVDKRAFSWLQKCNITGGTSEKILINVGLQKEFGREVALTTNQVFNRG